MQSSDDHEVISSENVAVGVAVAPVKPVARSTVWRLRALFAFTAIFSGISATRSAPLLYFYRTGFACAEEQTKDPGDSGWSGSKYCGDKDGVIGEAQRLSSVLLPLQLGIEMIATPLVAALADRWSYIGVITAGTIFAALGTILLAATAAPIPDAGKDFHDESHSTNEMTTIMPIGVLVLARLALGITSACISAPMGALVISFAKMEHKGRYLMYLMASRGVGGMLGGFVGLAFVNMYLENYTGFFIALSVMWIPVFAPMACVRWGCPGCAGGATNAQLTAGAHDSKADDQVARPNGCSCASFCLIVSALRDTLREPGLKQILLSIMVFSTGVIGPMSILASFVQTALNWQQGLLPILWIAVGVPSGIAAGFFYVKYVMRRYGLAAVIRTGFNFGTVGMGVMCLIPWGSFILVLALGLMIWSFPAWIAMFILIAKRFEQKQQAQVQGLFEVAISIAVACCVPFWSYVLYDENADDKSRQALPFFVGFVCVAAGAVLIHNTPLRAFQEANEPSKATTSSA